LPASGWRGRTRTGSVRVAFAVDSLPLELRGSPVADLGPLLSRDDRRRGLALGVVVCAPVAVGVRRFSLSIGSLVATVADGRRYRILLRPLVGGVIRDPAPARVTVVLVRLRGPGVVSITFVGSVRPPIASFGLRLGVVRVAVPVRTGGLVSVWIGRPVPVGTAIPPFVGVSVRPVVLTVELFVEQLLEIGRLLERRASEAVRERVRRGLVNVRLGDGCATVERG